MSKQKKSKPLNAKEQIFVDEYLLTLKPEQAARQAGYAESTCKSAAYTWIKETKCPANKVHVYNAIQEALRKRSEKTGIDADWVLKRAAMIADFNINRFMKVNDAGKAYYDFSAATDDDWYCISEVTVDHIIKGQGNDAYEVERIKLKPESKIKALQMVGNHIAVQAFRENLQVDVVDRRDAMAAARKRAIERSRERPRK